MYHLNTIAIYLVQQIIDMQCSAMQFKEIAIIAPLVYLKKIKAQYKKQAQNLQKVQKNVGVVKSLTRAQFILMESAVVKDYKFQDLSLCIKIFFALLLIK